MTLYHITLKRYLSSILINGLICNSNNGGFLKKKDISRYHTHYKIQPIFLTSDWEYIINKQLTKYFIKYYNPILLEIDCSNLALEPEYFYLLNKETTIYYTIPAIEIMTKTAYNKCFIYKKNIEVERIKNNIDLLHYKIKKEN